MTTNADWEATVAQWTSVYREVYDDQSTSRFAGWIDYVTGRRIPDTVMEAWLDWSVRSVRRLHPRAVLEIGGGTGMIADGLADTVDRYVLTDPVTGGDAHPHPAVTSKLAGAHELARVLDDADRFDCVVVNSVIQHFPDVDYLAHVLAGLVPHLTDDANIYLGDLRHAGLHRAQCRERARVREPFATPDRIDDLAAQFIRSDPELLVSPRDIARAASGLPGPWHLRVRPRAFDADSDLDRHRFDAVLTRREPTTARGECRTVGNGLLGGTGPTPAELDRGPDAVSLHLDDPQSLWVGADDDLWFDIASLTTHEGSPS